MSDHIRKPATLITGANGEVGHGLIEQLSQDGERNIIAIDLKPVDESIRASCMATIAGDILDKSLLDRLQSEFEIHTVLPRSSRHGRSSPRSWRIRSTLRGHSTC